MAERTANERATRFAVKATMDRVKLMLVALLPAFWLLPAGPSLVCDNCVARGSDDSGVAIQCDKHGPSHSIYSTDISARPVTSRAGKHFGKSNTLLFEPFSESPSLTRLAPSEQRESPLALRTSWQFACRAAGEPRAPSSVS